MRIDPQSRASRADRVAINRPATLRDPSRQPIDVVIENLSETGALLRSEGTLPVGTLISLGVMGAGMQIARVSRVDAGVLACEFMLPLDPAAVAVARSADTLVSVAFPQMTARPAAPIVRPDPAIVPVRDVPGDAQPRPGRAIAVIAAAILLVLYLMMR